MKKGLCCLILALSLMIGCALADQISIVSEAYTDVPSVHTQDAVVTFEADRDCSIEVLQPNEKAAALLEEIYSFVWREGNRPARYYDEETQRKIAEIAQVDIDILHMTEFMSLELFGQPEETVRMQTLLDVDYRPGQLIVVVMGIEQEDGEYRWFPYKGEVPTLGRIEYDVPAQEYVEMTGQRVIFHVLTVRVGARGDILEYVHEEREPYGLPSKTAEDIVRVNSWRSVNGEKIEDTFRIFFVDKTEEMREEIVRIGEHLAKEKPAIEWFPQENIDQAQLLLANDADAREMVIYDIVAVMSQDYKDTYGDVATENVFAAAYEPDCRMVSILGFPIEDAEEAPFFEWYVQRTEPLEDGENVELVYKQLVIPTMEEEPAMLIVFSEPMQEEEVTE